MLAEPGGVWQIPVDGFRNPSGIDFWSNRPRHPVAPFGQTATRRTWVI